MNRRPETPIGLLADAVAIAREIVLWPVRIVLALAEPIGFAVLAAWRRIYPVLVDGWEVARAWIEVAEHRVRPVHGFAVVTAVAIGGLVASQFTDYRGVSVGTPQYHGVEAVAPAPRVDSQTPTWAHSITLLVVAAAAAALTLLALRGRWRTARLLVLAGAIVVIVSLAIDLPQGLDASNSSAGPGGVAVSTAYEGADAKLLDGFWAQLAAGVLLIVAGPALAVQLRDRRRRRGASGRRRSGTHERTGLSGSPSSPIQGLGT